METLHKNGKDLTGKKYGKLTVLHQAENSGGRVAWVVSCDCGEIFSPLACNLAGGRTISCGCSKITHNKSSYPEYAVWYSMIKRCCDASHYAYHRYGARGIGVDSSWMTIDSFLESMGRRPSKLHQLDRIDNNSGYSKENCRWALPVENLRNRSDSRYWFVNGVKYESMRHAAKHEGVAHSTIKNWCVTNKNGCYSERKYT